MMVTRDFAKAMLCSLGFAGAYVFGKIISTCAPALCLGFLRFFISSLCFLPFIKFEELKKATRCDWVIMLAAGLIGITFYNYLFYTAAVTTTSINIALINATIPLITLFITSILTFTIPTLRQCIAFFISFMGVAIVITKGQFVADFLQVSRGEFIMLLAATSWVTYSIMIQNLVKKISPVTVTFITGLTGLIFLFIFGFSQSTAILNLTLYDWLLLLYIGGVGTAFCYYLYSDTLKNIGARLATFLVFSTVPIFVALLSFWFEGTLITTGQIIGGCLVIFALFLNFKK